MPKQGAVAGLAAGLSENGSEVAHTGAAAGENRAAQPDLLASDDPDAELFAEFEAELDLYGNGAISPPAKRAPGRPKGSSRDTGKLAAFMRARGYRDPLEFLGALISIETKELGQQTGIEDHDKVLRIQLQAAQQMLPYWHRKLPIAVEHTGNASRPFIMIMDGPQGGRASGGDDVMSAYETVDFQEVTNPTADNSHDHNSHE